jgi:hypothetical protein
MRIPNDEWLPFNEATKAAEKTRAEAVREFIRWYLRRPGAKLPERPAAGTWSTPKVDQEQPADN